MTIEVCDSQLIELLTDPVMAAWVILKTEYSPSQAAAMRYDWWFRFTIDSGGQGTGKTKRTFDFANLRAILIPDQWVAVYYQTWTVGQQEFWPYFQQAMDRSELFRDQFKVHRNKVGEHKDPGNWWMEYKCGSRLSLPAPGHMNDARSQASRSFNTVIVDEWLRAVEMGEGLDGQILSRARRPCFNREHPIWGNHVKLKGHGESPAHKGHERYEAYQRKIKDGSSIHALYSFCYKDFPPGSLTEKIIDRQLIETERASAPEIYIWKWLGLWSAGISRFYAESVLSRCARVDIVPETQRMMANAQYILGFDTAPGMSAQADYSAAVIVRLREIDPMEMARMAVAGKRAGIFFAGGRVWEAAVVYAHQFQALGAPEMAGYIHLLNIRFGFSAIVLDPGGGGLLVYPELKKSEAIINNVVQSVIPLCTRDETLYFDKLPIVHIFKRGQAVRGGRVGGDFDELPHVGPQWLRNDAGLIAACHMQMRRRLIQQQLALPASLAEREHAGGTGGWDELVLRAQNNLDAMVEQLQKVGQRLNKQKQPLVAEGGYPLFGASGKKDLAYALVYAMSGVELLVAEGAVQEDGGKADF